jgi:thiol-disulfide isomerase/thioredoxin
MLLAGCGGSESSSSSVVPPPAPEVVDSGPDGDDAPGEMVLPPGEIPAPPTEDAPKAEGGIQMPEGATVPPDSAGAGTTDSGADSGTAAVAKIEYGTWNEIQVAAKSSGQITVVDLWSLSCEPCKKEFPGLVRLHRRHGSEVQCIAVDIDYYGGKKPPQHYEPEVAAFLKSVGASGFKNYISSTPSEDVYAATGIPSIPAVLVYDASGKLVKVFVDAGDTAGFTYDEDVIPLVKKMIG